MILRIDKEKCRIEESLNTRELLIETYAAIELTGLLGNEYLLLDECQDAIGPYPTEPYVVKNPRFPIK